MNLRLFYSLAALLPLVCTSCGRTTPKILHASDFDPIVGEVATAGALANSDCDAATDAWAIDLARQALEARENANDWPHGAEYQLLRRSAVQWWVTARRIDGYDDSGKPRFTSGWDRGIIIDDLGSVMFYVPAK